MLALPPVFTTKSLASVVPIKFVPAVVPALPVKFQPAPMVPEPAAVLSSISSQVEIVPFPIPPLLINVALLPNAITVLPPVVGFDCVAIILQMPNS